MAADKEEKMSENIASSVHTGDKATLYAVIALKQYVLS